MSEFAYTPSKSTFIAISAQDYVSNNITLYNYVLISKYIEFN